MIGTVKPTFALLQRLCDVGRAGPQTRRQLMFQLAVR